MGLVREAVARRRELLGLAVATGAIAGCGANSTGVHESGLQSRSTARTASSLRSTGTAEQSRTTFAAAANAICRRLNAEIAARETNGSSLAEIVRGVPGNVARERRALSELEHLSPPRILGHEWERVVAYRLKLAEELARLVVYARRSDAAAINALAISKKTTHGLLRKTATQAGLRDCAEVGPRGA